MKNILKTIFLLISCSNLYGAAGGAKRVFVALSLSQPVTEQILTVQDLAREKINSAVKARVFQPEHTFHVTLLFVGAVTAEQLEDVKKALALSASEYMLDGIQNLSLLPVLKLYGALQTYVVMNIHDGNGQLHYLRSIIINNLRKLGIAIALDHAYAPHITLGHLDPKISALHATTLARDVFPSIMPPKSLSLINGNYFKIDEFVLYQTAGPSKYVPVQQYTLSKGQSQPPKKPGQGPRARKKRQPVIPKE